MNGGNFDLARSYFEYVLGESFKKYAPLRDELEVRSQLIMCRLQSENSEKNLKNGLLECQYILDHVPQDVHVCRPSYVRCECCECCERVV